MKYRDILLPDPIRIKRGRGRPVELPAAVVSDDRIIAVFESEHRAYSYAHRLNKLNGEKWVTR